MKEERCRPGYQPSLLKGQALSYQSGFPPTLSDALRRAARTDRGITFIDDRGQETDVSYASLYQGALIILGTLQSSGVRPGQAVVLQLDELNAFLATFWACILGGHLPVPVLPFRNADPADSSFRKLQRIAGQLDTPLIVMSDRNAAAARSADSDHCDNARLLPGCRICTFGEISSGVNPGIEGESDPDDLAFLQFTSGSTSFPKGVQISQRNVMATIEGMMERLDVHEESRLLNWMPYYHDMGIIAGHLMAVVGRCNVVAMKPFTFVRRPLLWLSKIHEHRISITFSPNFGLKRVLEKARPDQLESLDLGCLDVILNGAEPISIKTSQRFLDLLNGHCKLSRTCLLAGYGLAEAGLAVSIAPRGQKLHYHRLNRDALGCGARIEHIEADNAKATWFADEGAVVAGMSLRIVDDNDQLIPVGTVGHVQIQGDSVTRGYYSNPEANARAFCDGWFRTGDLGFVHEDHFVITGRTKDVVFVNGQNYYSHDFEHACEDIEGLERLVVIGHHDDEHCEEAIIAFVACNRQYTGAREKTDILRHVQMRINQCFDVTPTQFVPLKSTGEIPKTTSGKIIRHKLLANYLEGCFVNQCVRLSELLEIAPDLDRESASKRHVTVAELKLLIRSWWSEVLGISQKAIGDHDPFFSLGGTSIKAIEVLSLAEESVDCVITHDMFREHDTIHRLANHIARENIGVRCKIDNLVKVGKPATEEPVTPAPEPATTGPAGTASTSTAVEDDHIAIIGMGCIFPQADSIDEFWKLLLEGRDCVTEYPNDRDNINRYYQEAEQPDNHTVSKWGSFIENHHFDPKFFNLPEAEALTMDAHQRVFLTAACQAIQDAGLVDIEGSKMGVFVGASGTGFHQERETSRLTPSTLTGSLANLAASRVSHVYNLKGPSLTVDTACSSSLVSVDLACRSILDGESDVAIAGGVQLLENIVVYLLFSRAGILSPDGKCHTFSDRANGFVPGEGAGAVILKRYSDAIRDGDRIYSVIRSSATNNDGASLGIMAPNPEGQENVIRTALSRANIDPADIGYVEAHGTGTHIGDLIEVRSLSLAYNESTPVSNQSCAMGSVKTNMGHQLAAAGISGLIKASLAVYHKTIPATLNCDQPRAELKLPETPFFLPGKAMPWPKSGKRRLAAVNSFGFGGTNAHVIISAPYHDDEQHAPPLAEGQPAIICLSAKSEASLQAGRKAFASYANSCSPSTQLRDIAYTSCARRKHYRQHRLAVVTNSLQDAAAAAADKKVSGVQLFETRKLPHTQRRVAWLFSGQGSQHPGMGSRLFHSEPVFREVVNSCDEIARPALGYSLRELLTSTADPGRIDATAITQPLVFTMDYAVARLWQSLGVKPDFLLGHSIGEYVAACLSGVFSLEDALNTVIRRGELMGALPGGTGMTATLLPVDELESRIRTAGLPLDISACNGPQSTVASGSLDALEQLHAELQADGIVFSPLKVSHAFHSRHMEPVLGQFRKHLDRLSLGAARIPVVSNVTGRLYQGDGSNPDYWVEHIRKPVQFHQGIQTLAAAGTGIYLEVGAQVHLTGQVRRMVSKGDPLIVSSLPKYTGSEKAGTQFAVAMASLYSSGIDLDWPAFYRNHGERRWQQQGKPVDGDRRQAGGTDSPGGRVESLPSYAFEQRSMFRSVDKQPYPFRHLFARIDDNSHAYQPDPGSVLFRHHVINRLPMLSAAGQCDLISHLHAESFSHAPKCLRGLSFHQPWLATSKLVANFDGKAEKAFSITDEKGRLIFKGHSNTQTRGQMPAQLDVESIKIRLHDSCSGQQLYGLFRDINIDYGEFHSNIETLYYSAREALATLKPAETDKAAWQRGYYLQPGILDSAFQAAAGLLMPQDAADDSAEQPSLPLMVPVGIDSLCLFRFIQDGEYYAHVTLDDSQNANPDADIISCNIGLYDRNGQPYAFISKLSMKRMRLSGSSTGPKARGPHPVGEIDRHAGTAEFFHLTWQEQALANAPTPSRWLVYGSPTGIEKAVATDLAQYGLDVLLVPYEHWSEADETQTTSILDKAGSVDGILYLGDYDASDTGNDAADTTTVRRLHTLFRAVSKQVRKNRDYRRIRILRATRHAYSAAFEGWTSDTGKSPATGFLRTARLEFPLLDVRQSDFGAIEPSSLGQLLAQELATPAADNPSSPESLYHQGKRYTLAAEPLEVHQKLQRDEVFNSDRLFWIIGGTSGVGQLLARHLATHYRAQLVLSGSRTLPDPAAWDSYIANHTDAAADTIKLCRELEQLGSVVSYLPTDAASPQAIVNTLQTIRNRHGHIDGIYFSALQLDDRMIIQKDWNGYRRMIDMRINGASALVEAASEDKPRFIALFSSLAGLTGNLGQSDYSASNSYLDTLPCAANAGPDSRIIAIQWGPWSLGQQVSDVVLDNMNRNGFLHISPQLGMEALEKIILGDRNTVAFVPGSENAGIIANNINKLRHGLSSGPGNSRPRASTGLEETTMTESTKIQPVAPDNSQVQMMMNEFERQRIMLMNLFENQNTLLANLIGTLPAGTGMPIPTALTDNSPPPVAAPLPACETPPATVAVTPEPTPAAPVYQPAPAVETPPTPAPGVAQTPPPADHVPADSGIPLYEYVRSLMAKAVEMPEDDVDPEQNFMELGADSITAMSMVKEIETRYSIELPATLLFEYTTLNDLVEFLGDEIGDSSTANARQA